MTIRGDSEWLFISFAKVQGHHWNYQFLMKGRNNRIGTITNKMKQNIGYPWNNKNNIKNYRNRTMNKLYFSTLFQSTSLELCIVPWYYYIEAMEFSFGEACDMYLCRVHKLQKCAMIMISNSHNRSHTAASFISIIF